MTENTNTDLSLMDTFDQHRAELVGFAKSLHAGDPEDAVQEAALYALEKGYDESYQPKKGSNPLSYARGLVYWKVRHQQSAEARVMNLKVNLDTDDQSYTMESLEVSLDVQGALEQLPLAERVVAEGCLIYGESLTRMGAVFGLSHAWAHEQLDEARRKLAKLLYVYKR